MYKPKSNESATSFAAGFEVKDADISETFQAQLRFAGIGISLINRQLKELAYITFRDLEVKFGESKFQQSIILFIKWIQIDNQLYGGIFPIILYPSVVPKTGKEIDTHPSVHFEITRVKDDCKFAAWISQSLTNDLKRTALFTSNSSISYSNK